MTRLRCASCGGEMEIAGKVPDNVKIKCPHCGEYIKIDKPKRIEVPTGANLPRFVPDDNPHAEEPIRRRPDLHVRRPTSVVQNPTRVTEQFPPSEPVSSKGAKPDFGNWLVMIFAIGVIVSLGVYWMFQKRNSQMEALPVSEKMALNSESDGNDNEAKRQEEKCALETAEREKEKREKEREERRIAMAEREAKREKTRLEAEEKAARERQLRAMIGEMQKGFLGASSIIASDFPSGKRPFDFAEDGVIVVVGEDYVASRSLYRLTIEGKALRSAQRISQQSGIESIVPDDFVSMIADQTVLAKMESGPVWICGKTEMNELIDFPMAADLYSPLADFIGKALPVLNELRTDAPSVKYRISLKAKKGSGEIKMGIVEKEIDLQAVRSKIRERLVNRKLKSLGAGIRPPKMKKFKRTVVFYEGEIMKTELGGLTKIPRHYVYRGSGSVTTARERWLEFAKRAEEEERKELEVEAENQRRMAEYRRKTDELLHNAKPTEAEVDAELSSYRLFIERSRTKMPKE